MMIVTLGQLYSVGERPIVILFTSYIIRLARPPDTTKIKYNTVDYISKKVVIIYANITIGLYSNRTLGQQ